MRQSHPQQAYKQVRATKTMIFGCVSFTDEASPFLNSACRGPKNFLHAGIPSYWDSGRGWPLETCPFPICVTMSNLDVPGQTTWASVRSPKNLGDDRTRSLRGMFLIPSNTPFLSISITVENLVALGQNGWCVITEIPKKIWPFASAFEGHSRSLERSQKDWLRTSRSNYLPISYRLRDVGRWLQNFPTPMYLTLLLNSSLGIL